MTHLTEEQRHGIADGTLQDAAAADHLRGCAECSADVERIRRLMTRVQGAKTAASDPAVAEMWPKIRETIEQQKVVAIGNRERGMGNGERWSGNRWKWAVGVVAAAGIIGIWATRRPQAPVESNPADSNVSLIALVDSTHAYQEEAQELLNHLELRRATMRPEVAQLFERDLKVIDVAIAELQDAIKRDPSNPALRRLLASSVRQKVDLLKRISNAS